MKTKKLSLFKKFFLGVFLVILLLAAYFIVAAALTGNPQNTPDNSAALTEKIKNLTVLDSDNDGLTDQDERLYNTDPYNEDTDNDGYLDGQEVASGYDPLKPSPGDKIEDVEEYINNLKPRPLVVMPEDSEINISQESGKEAIEKYFEQAKTPAVLKDPTIYQEAFSNAAQGNMSTIDLIITELENKYEQLKKMSVPQEAVYVHKLTLALMPPLIKLFEDLKNLRTDPIKTLAAVKASAELAPYTQSLNNEINSLAKKYNIEPQQ
jgi:hypothetical protein